jgi:hypothetical protein
MKWLFQDILVLHRSTLNLLSYGERPSPQLSPLALSLFLHPVNKVSSVGQLLCNLYLNYDSCGVVE